MKKQFNSNENVQTYEKSNVSIFIYTFVTCVFAIAAIIGILIMTKQFFNNVENERNKYLLELANKNTQLTNFSIESKWDYTNSLKNVILRENIKTEKELINTINELKKRIDIEDIELFVMDNKGLIMVTSD